MYYGGKASDYERFEKQRNPAFLHVSSPWEGRRIWLTGFPGRIINPSTPIRC